MFVALNWTAAPAPEMSARLIMSQILHHAASFMYPEIIMKNVIRLLLLLVCVFLTQAQFQPPPSMPVFFSTNSNFNCTVPGTTTYLGISGNPSVTEANVARVPAPDSGTFTKLYVSIQAAVPASQTAVVTFMNNASAQANTCSVGAGSLTCNDTSHSASYSAGDLWDIKIVCSGGTSALSGPVTVSLK